MARDPAPQHPRPLPLPRWAWWFLAASYALIAACVAVDVVSGPETTLAPVLAALPVLAGVRARRARVPLLAGVVAIGLVFFLAAANSGVPSLVHVTSAVSVLAVTFTITGAVVLVTARERELAQVRGVAEAAQGALLRPPPPRVGGLEVAVRYVAAEAEARIGGDLYEVVETDFGVRVLLGDVRGKGLKAVQTAADVLGVFRDAARSEPGLDAVAARLDGALVRRGAGEEFVTAVLLTVPPSGHTAVLVNCGHPPPLLRHDATVTEVTPEVYAPPLGLLPLTGGHYRPQSVPYRPDDLLLLYTDGVSEARDRHDRFYPPAERVADMAEKDPDALLDRVLTDLHAWTGGGLGDDAALLALRRVR
ncbi:PP2C family protein-serine/threonine phosphatase [Streptomyces sp. MI02-7b]|uniref:PP2C family protein-serine/threonine phosphatase n=1 Tax=Streptomyces sp. MI02-7b TaxID=462941 RepID=UPI0029AEBDF4|nr:PP2C family protein-serine/threonine phosphatase [Streptomyces sp. MI02-7b]MDX3077118.1 PP2C family protein-serine/threonine phosphatase [Streptomyces sp. MI02-7b]